MSDASAAAATYFEAWQARDFARLRSVIAGDVDFAGPLDLATSLADPVPVANWMRVQDGKITRIRVAFDPRGIVNGS
jgi:ketosteroid isomerase-like protein